MAAEMTSENSSWMGHDGKLHTRMRFSANLAATLPGEGSMGSATQVSGSIPSERRPEEPQKVFHAQRAVTLYEVPSVPTFSHVARVEDGPLKEEKVDALLAFPGSFSEVGEARLVSASSTDLQKTTFISIGPGGAETLGVNGCVDVVVRGGEIQRVIAGNNIMVPGDLKPVITLRYGATIRNGISERIKVIDQNHIYLPETQETKDDVRQRVAVEPSLAQHQHTETTVFEWPRTTFFEAMGLNVLGKNLMKPGRALKARLSRKKS